MSAASSSEVTRSCMRIAADEIVGVCDGTPGAHDAMILLCRGIAERTSGGEIEPTAEHIAMLSSATELARGGAKILAVECDSEPPVITVDPDPKYLRWVPAPPFCEFGVCDLMLGGARAEWEVEP